MTDWGVLERLAAEASQESGEVDFKQSFDSESRGEWVELVKDLVAMANSGGGVLVIGVRDAGQPSLFDVRALSKLDAAHVTDKIRSYTGLQCEVQVFRHERLGKKVVSLLVGGAPVPMPFTSPGTYAVPGVDGKQKNVFSAGVVVFRHGAKSEPGTAEDFRAVLDRRLAEIRRQWLADVRRVIEAPPGSVVSVFRPDDAAAEGVRITHDASAPLVRGLDPNKTHPFRAKELLARLRRGNPGLKLATTDVVAVVKAHQLDENPTFVFKPLHNSRHYSEAFAQWLEQRVAEDEKFILKAHAVLRAGAMKESATPPTWPSSH